ncbi:MAG: hypothetical protein U9N79_05590 [Actinomycetota bacterium]|nr:hypothetical protein [Actinomycetota bacterium]
MTPPRAIARHFRTPRVVRPWSGRSERANLKRPAEEAIIRDPIDTPRSNPTRTTAIWTFFLLGVLVLFACDTSESTTAAPPPDTISSTTTAAPSPSTTLASDTERTLEVPTHAAPVIDGILDAGEWDGSTTLRMSDNSLLRWMHADTTLYVSLESDAVGAVNLVIALANETWVLHSSAALGSARYLPGDGIWDLSHGFDWCCRSATDDAARLRLLDDEGWQANIGFTGDDGIVEYQVTLPWNGAAVAVSYLTDSETSAFWPADLSSEARKQLVGSPPPERTFNLDEWYTLVPVDG